jgi:predicted amidohydrolase
MRSGPEILLRDVEVPGIGVTDVLLADARVADVGTAPNGSADLVIDGGGNALLPGLHDHHCHILAAAAALTSVPCEGIVNLRGSVGSEGARSGVSRSRPVLFRRRPGRR